MSGIRALWRRSVIAEIIDSQDGRLETHAVQTGFLKTWRIPCSASVPTAIHLYRPVWPSGEMCVSEHPLQDFEVAAHRRQDL
jgi:hypothetical protein